MSEGAGAAARRGDQEMLTRMLGRSQQAGQSESARPFCFSPPLTLLPNPDTLPLPALYCSSAPGQHRVGQELTFPKLSVPGYGIDREGV